MNKNLILSFFFYLIISTVSGQVFEWAKPFPTHYSAWGNFENCVSVDADKDNVLFTGFFRDSIRIGSNLYLVNGASSAIQKINSYVVKYDLEGRIEWSKHIIGTELSNVSSRLDANQNIIITGLAKDSLTIGTTIFRNPGYSIFIVKLDGTGNLLWARHSTSTPSIPISPLLIMASKLIEFDLDLAGNIYMAGTYNASLTFGTNTISTNINFNNVHLSHFMLKYNSAGTLLWFKDLPQQDMNEINMAVTGTGEIYYTADKPIAYLKKYDTNGNIIWTKNLPEVSNTWPGVSLGTDKAGNAYMAAVYSAPATLGSTTIPAITVSPFKPGYYYAKIDKAGNWKWVNEIVTEVASSIILPKKIPAKFSIAGRFIMDVTIGDSTFTTPWQDLFIAQIDTSGVILAVDRIKTASQTGGLDPEAIATDEKFNTYLAGAFMDNVQIGAFNLNALGSTTQSRFLTKQVNSANSVSGSFFRDINNNGIKDAGDSPVTGRILEILAGPINSGSTANGNFGALLPTGTFNIMAPTPPRYYTVTPGSYSVVFNGLNQHLSGKDFAFHLTPNRPDVKVTLTALTPARPGFNLTYLLTYENVGTTIANDSIWLKFNANILTYNATSIPFANQKAGELTWGYQNLQPGEKRNISIFFTTNAATAIGTSLTGYASIGKFATDLFLQDNYDTLTQVLTGSFDPNDKQVNYAQLAPSQLLPDTYLDYTIRFQNTGTDTAFTVLVRDELPDKLLSTSFEILSASHPYTFRVMENGKIEWRFDNILLPHSNRNELASHGFIRYRIKPKSNLFLGDEIKSRAAIYFDYNAPVITNYAITKIENTLSVKDKNAGLTTFNLFPNPARDYVRIEAELMNQLPVTLKLTNLLGQQIIEKQYAKSQKMQDRIETENLAKGVYLLSLQTEKGIVTKRLVIQ